MQARSTWGAESLRFAGLLFASAVLSLLWGPLWAWLLLAMSLYLGLHLVQISRLERGLRSGKRFRPPEAGGIWEAVFQQLDTQQKRHRKRKRKLREILKRFKTSTAAMPDATVVLGPNAEIEWFNTAAAGLLRLRAPQDIRKPVANLLRHPSFVEYLAGGDYAESVDIPAPHDDSIRLSVRIVPYGGGQRLLIARDVTHLHRLEVVRKDFVANASHELLTPLTVVRGYVETLRDSEDNATQPWDSSLQQIELQAERMQRIVEDLLLLSQLEADSAGRVTHMPVDIPRLVQALVVEARRLSAQHGHAVEAEVAEGLEIYGDEDQLRSAFSNLIVNAIQYTPEGGSIMVRWSRDEAGAHFSVADTGEGIPAKDIPRLAERFYRVDVARSRRSGGTGLGLAIVKHALGRHRARLRVESELGKGSTFTCDFPPECIVDSDPGDDTEVLARG